MSKKLSLALLLLTQCIVEQDQLPANTHKASDFLAVGVSSFQRADQLMARLVGTAKPALLLCKGERYSAADGHALTV